MPQGGLGAAERPARDAGPGGESLRAGVGRFTGARVVSRLQKSVRSIFPIRANQAERPGEAGLRVARRGGSFPD
jgi:hypothetical protein